MERASSRWLPLGVGPILTAYSGDAPKVARVAGYNNVSPGSCAGCDPAVAGAGPAHCSGHGPVDAVRVVVERQDLQLAQIVQDPEEQRVAARSAAGLLVL